MEAGFDWRERSKCRLLLVNAKEMPQWLAERLGIIPIEIERQALLSDALCGGPEIPDGIPLRKLVRPEMYSRPVPGAKVFHGYQQGVSFDKKACGHFWPHEI